MKTLAFIFNLVILGCFVACQERRRVTNNKHFALARNHILPPQKVIAREQLGYFGSPLPSQKRPLEISRPRG
jgi:hypothetical protein